MMRRYLLTMSLILGLCLVLFQLSQRRLTGPWMALALNPEMAEVMVTAMENQRRLADLEPQREQDYRDQFEQTRALLAHLEVLRANRVTLTRRYNLVLFSLLGGTLLLLVALQIRQIRRTQRRLDRIGNEVERLARGETDITRGDPGRDALGRISEMIATASRAAARDRRRLKSLENLEQWQESSRRIAHEIRTPLTGISLELRNMLRWLHKQLPDQGETLTRHERNIGEELDQLRGFTDAYTSFAKIGKPRLATADLNGFLVEFAELYQEAWPGLRVLATPAGEPLTVAMDRRLIRQVLVNLGNNSANALGEAGGEWRLHCRRLAGQAVIDVIDNGPGIPADRAEKIFQPYFSGNHAEGMGLGLAICKKIMLDHGGDLELPVAEAGSGAHFQLSLPLWEDAP